MKILLTAIVILFLSTNMLVCGPVDNAAQQKASYQTATRTAVELEKWVDPFIGTGGYPLSSGMTFPGPSAPFGMIQPGPDTTGLGPMNMGRLVANMACGGYYYGHILYEYPLPYEASAGCLQHS